MIDINNREEVIAKLYSLNENSVPAFGRMTAHHMIEHLTDTLRYSFNKRPQKLYYSEEKANRMKSAVIESDVEMPVGFKSPVLGDDLPVLESINLQEAIKELEKELEYFERYFEENRGIKTMNPVMGPLNKEEWIIFHNKHFSHHFKQFQLL